VLYLIWVIEGLIMGIQKIIIVFLMWGTLIDGSLWAAVVDENSTTNVVHKSIIITTRNDGIKGELKDDNSDVLVNDDFLNETKVTAASDIFDLIAEWEKSDELSPDTKFNEILQIFDILRLIDERD
jgi:hypothetical protein